MPTDFRDVLNSIGAGESAHLAAQLEQACLAAANILSRCPDAVRPAALALFQQQVETRLAQTTHHPVTPEILEWSRANFSVEVALAGLKDIETTGGLEFKDFIKDLEQAAYGNE